MKKKFFWMLLVGIGVMALATFGFYMSTKQKLSPSDATIPDERIRVTTPQAGALVESPLVVTGDARGTWYFGASFPVRLLDARGKQIAVTPAQAEGEWMTEDFVPFQATLTFDFPETETGILVFEKDNPSGLPEHAAEVRIPIRFSFSAKAPSVSGLCHRTGCSGQICADEDVITTCEYRPEYACYKNARCERQENGRCGWTETVELRSCLGGKEGGDNK